MPAVLTGEGLFAPERAASLTPELFDELTAGGAPFILKVDYVGLPAPLEELDIVRLVPCSSDTAPRASLILRQCLGGFEFIRANRGGPAERCARVVRVERPGVRIDLESWRWRATGRLLARSLVARAAWAAGRGVGLVAAKFRRRCPVVLGSPTHLIAGVRAKFAHPDEVAHRERVAAAGLEAWEATLLTSLLPRGGGGRVLVFGARAGRESLALARRGVDVVGLDDVPALVAAAARRAVAEGLPARFVSAWLDALSANAGFDVVLCAAGVYEHTPTRARRITLLRGLAEHAAADGVVVVMAGWHRDRGPRHAVVDGARWLLRRILGERFTTEPGDRLVRHLSLASSHETTCFFHVFQDPEEVTREIDAAGLDCQRDPEGAWIVRRRRP
jgi:2-polyprenyl-3-methyl-5-hydroxy-6-metoxy-1,4-benzoquinol methylase